MADSLATPSETSDPNTPENSDLNPQIPSDAASKHMGCVHTPARLELLSDVLMAQGTGWSLKMVKVVEFHMVSPRLVRGST